MEERRWKWLVVLLAVVVYATAGPGVGIWWTARSACEATNRATHKFEIVVDALTAPATYPPHVLAPQRTAIDAANTQRAQAQALTHKLLRPGNC